MLLPRIKSAKEGVKLLGEIVETKGAGEGFGVVFVDANELWYFETGTGHKWIASKIPQDEYFVTANQGRLHAYKENDPNFMGAKMLSNLRSITRLMTLQKMENLTSQRPIQGMMREM